MCLRPRYGHLEDYYDGNEEGVIKRKLLLNRLSFSRDDNILVPCGKCFECLRRRKDDWVLRCMLEMRKYDESCVITLTYSDEYNTVSLEVKEFQDFMKRLRKRLSSPIKYIYCGEYGDLNLTCRPHFHACIFGWNPPDRYFFKYDKKGYPIFRSPILEKVWTKGFSSIVDVNEWSLGYVCKYLQKFENRTDYAERGLNPPFFHCSQGLGALDTLPNSVLDEDLFYLNGRRYNTPRYYLKKLDSDQKNKIINKRRAYCQDLLSTDWSEILHECDERRFLLEERFRNGS